jgi:PAS domain S-box-containing protein
MPQVQMVNLGNPIYAPFKDIPGVNEDQLKEGIDSIAVIPIMHENQCIAVMNLASHTHSVIPEHSRVFLETLSMQVGEVIARAKTEEALRKSETLYRTLIDTMPDGVTVTDTNMKIILANQMIADMQGVDSPDVLIGMEGMDFIVPEDQERVIEQSFKTLEDGIIRTGEYTLQRRDGSTFLSSISASVVRDEDGVPTHFITVSKDITDEKKAEDALRESEELYRTILDTLPVAVAVADGDGHITKANSMLAKLQGVSSPDELLGIEGINFVHPDYQESVIEHSILAIQEGMAKRQECTIVRRDGSVFPAEMIYTVVKDSEGNPTHFITLTTDISERLKAERELRESEEKFSLFADHFPGGFFIKDDDSKFIYVNKFIKDTFKETDFLGSTALQSYVEKDIAIKHTVEDEKVQNGLVVDVIETIPDLEGNEYVYRTIKFPLPRDDGSVLIGGLSIDITNLRRTEAVLESERKQLTSIFDSITEGIYVCDPETHEILFVNKFLTEAFGRDLVGKTCYEAFQGFDEPCKFCTNEKIKELSGEPYQWEYHNPVINRDFMITDRLIKWSDGRDVRFELAIDITAEKNALRELQEAQEKLVRQEKLAVLGKLSGGIGHELRNPLGAIKNAVYFLKMALENPNPDIEETLSILDTEVMTSELIISSLLDFARPKPPTRQKVKISELIDSSLSRVRVPSNVDVVIKHLKNPPLLLADPIQLSRVFINLGRNAVQAMPDGGKLTISTKIDQGWMTIGITDTGIGMTEDVLSKLFEPLYTTKAKGIGLGLPISKSFVEAHGGTIEVKSKEGIGSTFAVKLPVTTKEVD